MPKGKSRKQLGPEAPKDRAGGPPPVNKTEAIRSLIEEWARAGRQTAPKALTEELKRRYSSKEWSLSYVSSIKSKLKRKQPAPPVTPSAGETGPIPASDPAALVLAVKNLARQAGGLDRLKRLIEALQSDT
jgi:hypothetical protein